MTNHLRAKHHEMKTLCLSIEYLSTAAHEMEAAASFDYVVDGRRKRRTTRADGVRRLLRATVRDAKDVARSHPDLQDTWGERIADLEDPS